jgi:hypothetical protein
MSRDQLLRLGALGFNWPAYCVLPDPCFPSPAVLNAFNCSINGRLLEVTRPAYQCQSTECTSAEWRASDPVALQHLNFESAASFHTIRTLQESLMVMRRQDWCLRRATSVLRGAGAE